MITEHEPVRGFGVRRIVRRLFLPLAVLLLLVGPWTGGRAASAQAASDSTFATLVERLSEPGGYFDTDNLISNETSYLHVFPQLDALGVSEGAYIGVGPDQNFSYIAAIEPEIAFIIDIRRDNLLHLLLYRALFELAPSRIEYLSIFFGRPAPPQPAVWASRSLEEHVAYIDESPTDPVAIRSAHQSVREAVQRFGISLSDDDLVTIRRFHQAFIDRGLDLRFQSYGRAPQPYYPTYRQLVLATDLAGGQRNYLVSERSYGVVRTLQQQGRIVPVVGDLAGPHALKAIGDEIRQRRLTVSAFYTSNVEFYIAQDGLFGRYLENLEALPAGERSVIIRSYFGGGFRPRHPRAVPGHRSTQLVQPLARMVDRLRAGEYGSYFDLVEDVSPQ